MRRCSSVKLSFQRISRCSTSKSPLGLRQENGLIAMIWIACVLASSILPLPMAEPRAACKLLFANSMRWSDCDSIRTKWRAANIPFVSTESGDPDFLEWASRTRRGAIIWYFPSHCVHFCGMESLMDKRLRCCATTIACGITFGFRNASS